MHDCSHALKLTNVIFDEMLQLSELSMARGFADMFLVPDTLTCADPATSHVSCTKVIS